MIVLLIYADWPTYKHVIVREAQLNASRRLVVNEHKATRSLEQLWRELRLKPSMRKGLDSVEQSFEKFTTLPAIKELFYQATTNKNDGKFWRGFSRRALDVLRRSGMLDPPRVLHDKHGSDHHHHHGALLSTWDTSFKLESPISSSSLSSGTYEGSQLSDDDTLATSVSSVSSFDSAVSELNKIAPSSFAFSALDDDDDDDESFLSVGVPSSLAERVESEHSSFVPDSASMDSVPSSPASQSDTPNHEQWTPFFRCDRCMATNISADDVFVHDCPLGGESWLMSIVRVDELAPGDAGMATSREEEQGHSSIVDDAELEGDEFLSISFARSRRIPTRTATSPQNTAGRLSLASLTSISVAKEDHEIPETKKTRGSKVAYCQACSSTLLVDNGKDLVSLPLSEDTCSGRSEN